MSYAVADLKKDLATIPLDGFKLKRVAGGFLWEKKTAELRLEITAPTVRGSDGFKCQGILAKIVFIAAEKTLRQTIELVDKATEESFGVILNCSDIEGVLDPSLFDLWVHDSMTFGNVRVALEQAVFSGAFPFFEKYSSIERAAEWLSTLSFAELVSLVPAGRIYLVVTLILQMAKHPSYESTRDDYHVRLKKRAEESTGMRGNLLVFGRLFVS